MFRILNTLLSDVSTADIKLFGFILYKKKNLSSIQLFFWKGQESRSTITFPPAARRMETLNDLLAASDVISLHCALTDETVQILSAECLQHIKPGTLILVHALAFSWTNSYVSSYVLVERLIVYPFRGLFGKHWKQPAFR